MRRRRAAAAAKPRAVLPAELVRLQHSVFRALLLRDHGVAVRAQLVGLAVALLRPLRRAAQPVAALGARLFSVGVLLRHRAAQVPLPLRLLLGAGAPGRVTAAARRAGQVLDSGLRIGDLFLRLPPDLGEQDVRGHRAGAVLLGAVLAHRRTLRAVSAIT